MKFDRANITLFSLTRSTVEVTGSNPVSPTKLFNNLAISSLFSSSIVTKSMKKFGESSTMEAWLQIVTIQQYFVYTFCVFYAESN